MNVQTTSVDASVQTLAKAGDHPTMKT